VRTSDLFSVNGQSVLVCGAGGLGTSIVARLVEQGAHVTVADVSETSLRSLANQIHGINTIAVDLTDENAVCNLVGECGDLDALVHAVGINPRRGIIDTSLSEWESTVNVNLKSACLLGREAAKNMLSNGGGSMVFLSSVAGLLAHKDHGVYAASKGGLNQLLRVMAHEFASQQITVNGIAPGYIETDLTTKYLQDSENRARLLTLIPMGVLGKPSDLVGLVQFLLSPAARFITGQIMYVDGGRTLV
jgi:NAD(P)-dependent dehydrogenase (short-subunit alcohol dehydrogenase family)